MSIHGQIPHDDADRLHPPAVVQEADPGAIGAGKAWFKESTGELRIRNVADTGWSSAFNSIPNAVMSYAGTWNATTNSPALADGGGNPDADIGNMYRVTTAGTQDLGSGAITYAVGDYVILNASKVWEKLDTTDLVQSVAGLTGAPTLTQILDTLAGAADGDIVVRSGGSWVRLPAGTAGQRLKMVAGVPAWSDEFYTIPLVIGDGVNAITAGLTTAGFHLDIPGTIVAVTALSMDGSSGDIEVDILKDVLANFPPTSGDKISGTDPVEIVAGTNSQDTVLATWTPAIVANDVIFAEVVTASGFTMVLVSLKVRKS